MTHAVVFTADLGLDPLGLLANMDVLTAAIQKAAQH